MGSILPTRSSPWPHRLSVALALVTFPLIWVGGLVTTYDAGMAVPDWPGTYGYNLLRYPWQTWLAGPWDLFIEHGHRLLGAAAGLLAIALVGVVWFTDRRRWLIAASFGALALVILQGALGGARVIFDERLIAMIHGCVGPLFFAYLGGLVVATSPWWESAGALDSSSGQKMVRLTWITAALVYGQLVVGAMLRHVPLVSAPIVFPTALIFHLLVAAILAIQSLRPLLETRRLPQQTFGLTMLSVILPTLVAIQLLLGAATYVAKYAFPIWLDQFSFAANYVVQEKSLAQSLITTAHVANGSLILFMSVMLAMRSTRLFCRGARLLACPSLWQTGSLAPPRRAAA